MQRLRDLSDHVSRYNLIGKLKLANLKIAIIQTKDHAHITQELLEQLHCIETQSFVNFLGIGGYKHYRTNLIKNGEVHVIDSIYGE